MAKDIKIPEMNPEIAGQMLQNIFESCDVEPNNVPTENLESYTEYREDKFRSKRILLLVILAIFICIPFFFAAPSVSSLNQVNTGEYPKYNMSVDSILPVSSVTATIDGKKVHVYETQPKVYSIEPEVSGPMIIKVKTINGQYTTHKIEVYPLDKAAPKIISNKVSNGRITLNLSDDVSGVDYENVLMMTANGDKFSPVSYDEDNCTVTFKIPTTSADIFVPDKSGNTLQLALTLK